MSSGGKYSSLFDRLPKDVGALVTIVQGLAIHEYAASDFYGFVVPEKRTSESHIRQLEKMLDRLFSIDDRPLTVARPPDKRLVGVCHHFMLLLVGMLRAKGIPARGRCGFGSYFNRGTFEDHWVCEYWKASEKRWVLVDPQFDEIWRKKLGIDHDVLDLPRDRFLVAADAWTLCRAGKADPSKFGIRILRGRWFIAGNLVHDVASLNKVEMLPWDTWGAMPGPNEQLRDEQLVYFDELANLTRTPDSSFAELRALYEEDDRLRVPPTVFNAVLNRPESI